MFFPVVMLQGFEQMEKIGEHSGSLAPSLFLPHNLGPIPSYREDVPAQPVDATPSDINLFSKGGVYDV